MKTIYDSLSLKKRGETNESVSVFDDLEFLNISQSWERELLHGMTHSRVIVLLISAKVFISLSLSTSPHLLPSSLFLFLIVLILGTRGDQTSNQAAMQCARGVSHKYATQYLGFFSSSLPCPTPPSALLMIATQTHDNFFYLTRYECAILQNKLKRTPVVPVFLAGEIKEENGGVTMLPFNIGEFEHSRFPQALHSRSRRAQHIIDHLR